MKKLTAIIATIFILCTLSLALFACEDITLSPQTPSGDVSGDVSGDNTPVSETMTLVLLDGDYLEEFTVPLDEVYADGQTGKGVFAVLDYLKAKGEITYTADSTGFLTQVNGIKQEGNKYIYLYTSVEKDADVSQYASTIEYKGKQYPNSGFGASQMTIEKDCVIIISVIVW